MTTVVLCLGASVAAGLLAALVLTLLVPRLRIWPTAGPGTWQSYVFWPLFRGLNVLCFVAAGIDRTPFVGTAVPIRLAALAGLAASVALFVYAFLRLGRDNSYGAREGLVTDGIYRISRNPQNAMLMVVYGCLAVAADSALTYLLSGAMVAAYFLMVLAEEPWLAGVYGDAYRRYCAEVPRFIHWRRAWQAMIGGRTA